MIPKIVFDPAKSDPVIGATSADFSPIRTDPIPQATKSLLEQQKEMS
jgi:hypothetical protein